MTAIQAKERCQNDSLCQGLQETQGRQGCGVELKADREHKSDQERMHIPLGSSSESCVARNNGELGTELGTGEGEELSTGEGGLGAGELGRAALTCVIVA